MKRGWYVRRDEERTRGARNEAERRGREEQRREEGREQSGRETRLTAAMHAERRKNSGKKTTVYNYLNYNSHNCKIKSF